MITEHRLRCSQVGARMSTRNRCQVLPGCQGLHRFLLIQNTARREKNGLEGQVDLHRKFRFSLTLIQPHWLTGRKTPLYLLTYSTSLTANMENTNVFYRDTRMCKHCSTLSLPKILHCWCNFLSRFVSQVRSESITIQADQMMCPLGKWEVLY